LRILKRNENYVYTKTCMSMFIIGFIILAKSGNNPEVFIRVSS
jgi:hypothetical protein